MEKLGEGPGAVVLPDGPTGRFVRLTQGTQQWNTIGFDRTIAGPFQVPLRIDFDFRVTPIDPGVAADGFSMSLLETARYGTNGAAPRIDEKFYLPSLSVSFVFLSYPGYHDNSVSIWWRNAVLTNLLITDFPLTNGVFNHARVTVLPTGTGTKLKMTVTPSGGSEITLFDRVNIPGMIPFESRLGFGARCGGIAAYQDLDNIRMELLLPPSVSRQPVSQSVVAGKSATLEVGASGTGPLSYQWNHDGQSVPGETNALLLIKEIRPTDAGSYTVTISNSEGILTSQPAVLGVIIPPTITVQPQSLSLAEGARATISVAATGSEPISYQWSLNGQPVAGAIEPSLVVSDAQPSDAGDYTVSVSNAAGSVTSRVAVLTVNSPPIVTIQPESQSVPIGSNVILSVGVSGTPPLAFQWFVDGIPIAKATSAALPLQSVQLSDFGTYSVVISNSAGTAASHGAVLNVGAPPVIGTQPQSQSVIPGSSATMVVIAAGTAPLAYQWFMNGTPIAGATNATFSITNAQSGNAGAYTVAVRNGFGALLSQAARLDVASALAPPVISVPPFSQTAFPGDSVTLSVSATGTEPLTYQWLFNETPLAGKTSSSLLLSNIDLSQAGSYSVVIANGGGTTVSSPAKLDVVSPTAPSLALAMYAGLLLEGIAGKSYEIQYKTDAAAAVWTSLATLSLTNSPLLWIDVQSTNQTRRIYQAILKP
ncbi:MAG: immunoglobulin domain-containing protein [Verrucomicrobiota bacterium]